MRKKKRKLRARERIEKRQRSQELITIFVRGKMKRIRKPPQIEGLDVDEFIRQNADPIWLHQNEMWEYMEENEQTSEPLTNKSDEDPF
jgi:hypothetical protein